MIKILTFLALSVGLLSVASAPWLPALNYLIVSVLQPQYIWPWAFQDFSVFKVSAGIVIVAWLIRLANGSIDWNVYKAGQFRGMLVLLTTFYLSSWLSPFQIFSAAVSADIVVGTFTTIVIMYFFLLPLIDRAEVVKYFAFAFILTTLYYTYWANDHYFSGNWGQFTLGRLNGPRGSPYRDGNNMSVLLTIGLSFVMFGIAFAEKRSSKILLMLSIPFIWHALILFASRGALLSAVSVTVFFAVVVRSRGVTALLVAGFAVILIWQGATLTDRTSATVSQAGNQSSEAPLNPRLVSWTSGVKLAARYPLLGVGPQRFIHATQVHYPGTTPHVAHNTFLNFSANTGIPSGVAYLSFFVVSFRQYRIVKESSQTDPQQVFVNYSCMGALIGFFVAALFLDLIIFEPFYFLLILMSANYLVAMRRSGSDRPSK